MAVKQVILTREGLHALENELEYLKTVKRKEIAEKIKVALSFGDLSENSEYDEAKNEQAMIESRIAEIMAMLKNIKLIDENEINDESVHIGSKIEVKMTNANGTTGIKHYKIVGSNEANPVQGRISDESVVGSKLLGCRCGDLVEIEVPAGLVKYEILSISK